MIGEFEGDDVPSGAGPRSPFGHPAARQVRPDRQLQRRCPATASWRPSGLALAREPPEGRVARQGCDAAAKSCRGRMSAAKAAPGPRGRAADVLSRAAGDARVPRMDRQRRRSRRGFAAAEADLSARRRGADRGGSGHREQYGATGDEIGGDGSSATWSASGSVSAAGSTRMLAAAV